MRFSSTLLFVETNNETYNSTTLNAVTAAKKLSGDLICLVVGPNSDKISQQLKSVAGISKIYHKKSVDFERPLPEKLSPFVHKCGKEIADLEYIIAASSSFTKSFFPRVASYFDVQPLTDVIEIVDGNTFIRPIYAGNALSKIRTDQKLKILTVRPTSFKPASIDGGNAKIEELSIEVVPCENTKWISETLTKSDLPQLDEAKVVLAGGRAFKNKENFNMLYGLAKKMNAAVGASRAAVDAEFCSNDLQIGQTGKVIAPELYIGFGISGAIQHVAGIKDSKLIVSVNTDPECPLSSIADYSLNEDIFKVIPEMESRIK